MEHYCNNAQFGEGENWFTYPQLYQHVVKEFPSGSKFVELGCWKGRSAAFMGVEIVNSGKDIKLDCIDLWPEVVAGQDTNNLDLSDPIYNTLDGQLMATFLKNIEPVANVITVIRGDSSKIATRYEDKSLDFVFIDADHSYEGVKKDIIAWLPKVKSGGILAGHDYGWSEDVRLAVNHVFGEGDFSDPWRNGCFMLKVG